MSLACADQIKGVVESGVVYQRHHFDIMLAALTPFDLRQPEVLM